MDPVFATPADPIWGNKDNNKTFLASHSVLGHVHSPARSISASFAITRSRWPLPPRVGLQPVALKQGKLPKIHKLSPFRLLNAFSQRQLIYPHWLRFHRGDVEIVTMCVASILNNLLVVGYL